jgi:hypothetical protein
MAEAFGSFKGAIQSLAMGKLDRYLDFTHKGKSKGAILTDPILLLHDLGKYSNMERCRGQPLGGLGMNSK